MTCPWSLGFNIKKIEYLVAECEDREDLILDKGNIKCQINLDI
jgi:hypothetical protein